MNEVTANYFREHLKATVDEVIENHDVLHVTRRNGGDFVVVSTDDWEAIAESLHLNQVPGLVDSIKEAAKEPLERGTKLEDLEW